MEVGFLMMDSQNTESARKNPIGQKGYTGNPGGRPKMPDDIRQAFASISRDSLPILRKIAMGEHPEAKTSDVLKAQEMAHDRAWGKPLQQLEAEVRNGIEPVDTSKLTPEQKDALLALALTNIDDQ